MHLPFEDTLAFDAQRNGMAKRVGQSRLLLNQKVHAVKP